MNDIPELVPKHLLHNFSFVQLNLQQLEILNGLKECKFCGMRVSILRKPQYYMKLIEPCPYQIVKEVMDQ
jgi:hypothetical protein